MNRFRESREYVGYAVEEVATHLSATVGEVLAVEAGGAISPSVLRTLCRLYLRPPEYLLGTAPEMPSAQSDRIPADAGSLAA